MTKYNDMNKYDARSSLNDLYARFKYIPQPVIRNYHKRCNLAVKNNKRNGYKHLLRSVHIMSRKSISGKEIFFVKSIYQ